MSAEPLRHLFNESQLPSMIANGALVPQLLRDDHLKEPGSVGEPFCTRAQMIRYLDADGQWSVEVFQYRRSDGSLGASGRPDPKRLRIEGSILALARPDATA